jgi:hypothetical protein
MPDPIGSSGTPTAVTPSPERRRTTRFRKAGQFRKDLSDPGMRSPPQPDLFLADEIARLKNAPNDQIEAAN